MLDTAIIIEKETTSTNDVGTPTETYEFLKETYAATRLMAGNTDYDELGRLPFSAIEFTVRYDSRINYKCRILYEDEYYAIKHVYVPGRKDWMKLVTIVFEDE